MMHFPETNGPQKIPQNAVHSVSQERKKEPLKSQIARIVNETLPLKLPEGSEIRIEKLVGLLTEINAQKEQLRDISTEIEKGLKFVQNVADAAVDPVIEESENVSGVIEGVTTPLETFSALQEFYDKVHESLEALSEQAPPNPNAPEGLPVGAMFGLGVKGVTTLVTLGNFFLKQKEISRLEELRDVTVRDLHLLNTTSEEAPEVVKLKQELVELTKTIDNLKEDLSNYKSDFVYNFAISAPETTGNALLVAKWLEKIKFSSQVLVPLQIASALAAVVTAGMEMREATGQTSAHSEYMEQLKPIKMSENLIQTLLDKRKSAFTLRLEKNAAPFNAWITRLISGGSSLEQDLQQELSENGIFLNRLVSAETAAKIRNAADLAKALRQDPHLKDKMLVQYVENKDTLSTSAKNILRERLLEIEKLNRNFFNFKSTKAKVLFGIAVFVAASIITLGGLVLVGFTFPLFVFTIPGFVAAGATVASILIGLDFLRRHKPHAFKMVLNGTYFKRWLLRIPLLLQKWRLDRANLSLRQNLQTLKFLSAKVNSINAVHQLHLQFEGYVPSTLDRFYKELSLENLSGLSEEEKQARLEKYREIQIDEAERYDLKKLAAEEEVETLEKSYKGWLENFKAVEARLKKARLKDFGLATGHKISDKEEKKAAGERDYTYKIYDLRPIVQALVDGEFWKDPDTRTLFESYTAISLPGDPEEPLSKKDREMLTKKLEEILESSMLRSSASLKKWLQTHS